ncbi:MAG: hypothetical protein V4519_01690 [Patescibacteria group bacterium]
MSKGIEQSGIKQVESSEQQALRALAAKLKMDVARYFDEAGIKDRDEGKIIDAEACERLAAQSREEAEAILAGGPFDEDLVRPLAERSDLDDGLPLPPAPTGSLLMDHSQEPLPRGDQAKDQLRTPTLDTTLNNDPAFAVGGVNSDSKFPGLDAETIYNPDGSVTFVVENKSLKPGDEPRSAGPMIVTRKPDGSTSSTMKDTTPVPEALGKNIPQFTSKGEPNLAYDDKDFDENGRIRSSKVNKPGVAESRKANPNDTTYAPNKKGKLAFEGDANPMEATWVDGKPVNKGELAFEGDPSVDPIAQTVAGAYINVEESRRQAHIEKVRSSLKQKPKNEELGKVLDRVVPEQRPQLTKAEQAAILAKNREKMIKEVPQRISVMNKRADYILHFRDIVLNADPELTYGRRKILYNVIIDLAKSQKNGLSEKEKDTLHEQASRISLFDPNENPKAIPQFRADCEKFAMYYKHLVEKQAQKVFPASTPIQPFKQKIVEKFGPQPKLGWSNIKNKVRSFFGFKRY